MAGLMVSSPRAVPAIRRNEQTLSDETLTHLSPLTAQVGAHQKDQGCPQSLATRYPLPRLARIVSLVRLRNRVAETMNHEMVY